MSRFGFDALVIVADIRSDEFPLGAELADCRDLEKTDHAILSEISEAVRSLGIHVYHYQDPSILAEHSAFHKNDLVLSIYGGESSRNRMAITPAICEAFKLSYIGPDTYGRIIAQDKEISKRLAIDSGLLTPKWRVIRSEQDASIIAHQEPPLVIKPLLEGSSIGISEASLQRSTDGAIDVALTLLKKLNQPVLVEQFIPGREVSYTKIESSNDDMWGLSEVVILGDPEYFSYRLFHAKEKTIRDTRRTVRNIDFELSSQDKAAIDRLLRTFGRYGYCRVDGRLCDGRFHFIELTPDAWLGRKGQFAMSYTEKGWSYEDVIAAIISSAQPDLQSQQSSD